jgi:hypothetical protein
MTARKRKTDAPVLETIVVDRRLWSVLHNMSCRITALEMATLRQAAPPKRTRKPKSAD